MADIDAYSEFFSCLVNEICAVKLIVGDIIVLFFGIKLYFLTPKLKFMEPAESYLTPKLMTVPVRLPTVSILFSKSTKNFPF